MATLRSKTRTNIICRCSRCAFNGWRNAKHDGSLEKAWKFEIFMAGWTAATNLCECEESECAAIEIVEEETPRLQESSSTYYEEEVLPATAYEATNMPEKIIHRATNSFEKQLAHSTPQQSDQVMYSVPDNREKSETWSVWEENSEEKPARKRQK